MAKSADKREKDTETSAGDAPAATPGSDQPAEPQQESQPQQVQVQIDDSQAVASYSNFCRVTGTPEELIVDFGFTPQPLGPPTEPIPVSQRIITNFYTAKRMLGALELTIQRHEATFGALEIDVQKRARP